LGFDEKTGLDWSSRELYDLMINLAATVSSHRHVKVKSADAQAVDR